MKGAWGKAGGMAMEKQDDSVKTTLRPVAPGVWAAPGARIIDRTGRKMLPIGRDGFVPAARESVVVDKTMLIADVLDSGYAVTLFCRPRRFGKTLNMTMMRAFFELPPESDPNARDLAPLFEGTEVWEADGGRYREHQGAYPVVHISFNTVKKQTWEASYGTIKGIVTVEYSRHAYLESSPALSESDAALFRRIIEGTATDPDWASSLESLCRMLRAYHDRGVVLLVDEYDAPVMAGYTFGYYGEVVNFLKGWLTGVLKDGGAALSFACLTGVQRISKESIFSDLNNITVSTALSTEFDERYGFTDAEVAALAEYLGHSGCMDEAREWYDGYRFGKTDVYNPWSVLNYLKQGCTPGVYWLNTSSNSVVGSAIRAADAKILGELYELARPGGVVFEPLDLGIVFPDIGVRADAMWSMLYLAGYLTTNDVAVPDDPWLERALRIPNREIRRLFEKEIPQRFAPAQQGQRAVRDFQRALHRADTATLREALEQILLASPSFFDLVNENSYHMMLLGLCFGIEGYEPPISNRESGRGRFDIQVRPEKGSYIEAVYGRSPLVTIEVKCLPSQGLPSDPGLLEERLSELAQTALSQIAGKAYDASAESDGVPRVRWGIAFGGKHVACMCERV